MWSIILYCFLYLGPLKSKDDCSQYAEDKTCSKKVRSSLAKLTHKEIGKAVPWPLLVMCPDPRFSQVRAEEQGFISPWGSQFLLSPHLPYVLVLPLGCCIFCWTHTALRVMPDSRHSSEITINAYEIIAVLFLASITKLLSGDQTTAVPTIQLQHFLLVKKKLVQKIFKSSQSI